MYGCVDQSPGGSTDCCSDRAICTSPWPTMDGLMGAVDTAVPGIVHDIRFLPGDAQSRVHPSQSQNKIGWRGTEDLRSQVSGLRSQVINSKQPNLGLTQESLRMVTARVLVVLSGSFTSQIEAGPTLT